MKTDNYNAVVNVQVDEITVSAVQVRYNVEFADGTTHSDNTLIFSDKDIKNQVDPTSQTSDLLTLYRKLLNEFFEFNQAKLESFLEQINETLETAFEAQAIENLYE